MRTKFTFLQVQLTCSLLFVFASGLAQQITYQQIQNKEGLKSEAKYLSYLSKDGSTYMVGGRVKIGLPRGGSRFTFITVGDGLFTEYKGAEAVASGTENEIKSIYVSGTKKAGYRVFMKVKGYANSIVNFTIDFENAVDAGEVLSYGMTSDEALVELKKAKDKLDLGLITQAEYDSIKTELARFIK